jgi:hypothetical protein
MFHEMKEFEKKKKKKNNERGDEGGEESHPFAHMNGPIFHLKTSPQ